MTVQGVRVEQLRLAIEPGARLVLEWPALRRGLLERQEDREASKEIPKV
jgi:hypothetical protein